jgi:type IV secretory pathway VirJ component
MSRLPAVCRALAARLAALALCALGPAGAQAQGPTQTPAPTPPPVLNVDPQALLGPLHISRPPGLLRGFVVLFSDRNGWDAQSDAAAAALVRAGAMVVGVDLRHYFERIDRIEEKCHSLAGDPEKASIELQRVSGDGRYHTPILAGIGQGGTLVQAVLNEALPSTFAAGVAIDPADRLSSLQPLCYKGTVGPVGEGFRYGAASQLNAPLRVGLTAQASAASRAHVARLQAEGLPLTLQAAPARGDAAEQLLALTEPYLDLRAAASGALAGLPLIEIPVGQPGPYIAVIISGDGGWRDIDKSLAEALHAQGIAVVGWDSLRYFWSRKSPATLAQDLAAVIDAFTGRWRTPEVVLIGYSFGANVLPFAFNGLSPANQARVRLISLLGLAEGADFEIRVAGWMGGPPGKDAIEVLPQLQGMDPRRVQCFYGEQDRHSLCPSLLARGAQVVRTTGSHHFDKDYARLARLIMQAAAAPGSAPIPAPGAAESRGPQPAQ